MKRVVVKFGLISGAILAGAMAASVPLWKSGVHSEVIGYTTMILAFVMIFAGIRSYREREGGGAITFGKALQVGILIALIASVMYVAAWEIISWRFFPDFAERYAADIVAKMRASGASAAAIAAKQKEMADFARKYRNPLIKIGMTFLEVFPVGLIVTIISAAILRKKPNGGASSVAAVVA
jgi:Protein of unknown function (DUF4199)